MTISRRSILKYSAYAAAAGVLGGGAWQLRPTDGSDAPDDIVLPAGSDPSLLIVYGSMTGSTGGQALWIAEAAQAQGYRVALYSAEAAPSPEEFDRVLIGSAIRAASWLDPVIDWVGAHAAVIAARPHSLFQCSMTCAGMLLGNDGQPLSDAQCDELRHDCDSLFTAAPDISTSDVAFFPGRLEFSRLTPMIRVGYPFVAGSFMQGDFRDRAGCKAWAVNELANRA